MSLVRRGECSHCGECCKPDPSPGTGLFSLLELADADRVEGYCPLYRRGEDGTSSCVGHGWHPFYLGGCINHPAQPLDLELTPSCSYSFVETA